MVDHSELYDHAKQYVVECARKRLRITRSIGFGEDGHVWATNQNTAIKAFERATNYNTESLCYERLVQAGIRSIDSFVIPKFLGKDDRVLVIEMTLVTPPYFLDFGKAHLDQPFEFEAGGYELWDQECSDRYEPDEWVLVKKSLLRLQSIGIYYYDAKPGNVRLE